MVIETFDLEVVFRVSVFIDRPQILVTGVFMHGEFKNHGTVMPKQKLPILRGIANYGQKKFTVTASGNPMYEGIACIVRKW